MVHMCYVGNCILQLHNDSIALLVVVLPDELVHATDNLLVPELRVQLKILISLVRLCLGTLTDQRFHSQKYINSTLGNVALLP
jgi:hypothetical protein